MNPFTTDAYNRKRILLLGAAGFIGRAVARALRQANAELLLVDRSPLPNSVFDGHPKPSQFLVDLLPAGSVSSLIRELQPDIVFNLAGYGVDRRQRDPDLATRMNVGVPTEAARAASQLRSEWQGLRFVHVGSALEYGTATGNLDENSEAKPTTLYGETKLAGTLAVAAAGGKCLTARLFMIYGPGEIEGRLLPSLIDAARTGRHIPMTDGLQRRDFTYVGDAAEGLLRLGCAAVPEKPEPIVNLATGELRSVKEFVEIAAKVLGLRREQLGFGELPGRAEEMAHLPVAVDRLKRRTGGWLPRTSIEAGVLESMEAYA